MPRTPLLRSLFKLSREHCEAEELGIAPAELRQRGLTRRSFIASAAAAATLSSAKLARGSAPPRICIIGAGISGLNCALSLADAGVASTVYEAGGRIGGRMYSNNGGYWQNGQVSEWGGELIDTGHKTILALARRFNLPVADLASGVPNGAEDTFYFFGDYYPAVQADTDFKPVHQALQNDVQAASYPTTYQINTPGGIALDNMSIFDWIESRVPGGHRSPMGMLLDVAYNIEYGAETSDQSALNLVYLLGYKAGPGNFNIFGASDERYHIVGGNQQLPQAIARQLGNVRLGWRLTSLVQNSDQTTTLGFTTASGAKSVTADYVVLTLPFTVLRNFDLSGAGFDSLKLQAINELGAGRNGKLQLQFSERLWNQTGPWPGKSTGASYADTGYQNTWDVTRAQAGATGILVDYTGGATTLSMKTDTAWTTDPNSKTVFDANTFLSRIEPVFPGLSSRWNGLVASSLPHRDPNLLLSYSYWRVGQYHTFGGYEKVRQGKIFFAGEHTSQDFQGFMEGGASEGARAATEVLQALGLK
jgi:monoamine oxidase